MPLKKLTLRAGVNQENTRYTNENGWYESDKVRFRQGTPEKIGGWLRISSNTFLGVCRSLWSWATLAGRILVGLGTNLKFYIQNDGNYYDITPTTAVRTLGANPFTTQSGSAIVTVTDATGTLFATNDFVTFNGATAVNGITVNGEYQLTYASATTYTITAANTASGNGSGGGSSVSAVYQIGTGPAYVSALSGWGGGPWGAGTWGNGTSTTDTMRLWNQQNFGPNLVYGPRGGAIYYWNSNIGFSPVTVTISNATPAIVSTGLALPNTTTVKFKSTGSLPTGLSLGTPYYVQLSTVAGLCVSATKPSAYATFTVTIASPAVLTITGFAPVNGTAVVLTTDQDLAAPLAQDTLYYIRNVVGQTCNLSLTSAGALITTTVAGSSTAVTCIGVLVATSSAGSGTQSISSEGIALTDLNAGTSVPLFQDCLAVSDTFRFVFAFGTNDYGSTVKNPMLIRWSQYESVTDWTPSAVNQAGSTLLSHGSQIISTVQTRQEIVVFTDSSLYSLQYTKDPQGAWATQLLGDNISIVGPNAVAFASGVVYWMGVDKFYKYDGRLNTLRCDLRQFIYGDINLQQSSQFFASTNEGFNEIWFFYCTSGSETVNRYVVYNYVENNGEGVWYYGDMARTAWLDSGLISYPLAATYLRNLVYHEYGLDDVSTGTPAPIPAYISSSEFDIDDGDRFGFVYRMVPDITFRGSTAASPQVTMTLIPMQNSGSGYNSPISLGGNPDATITRTATVPIEQFTGQVYVRVRGRQMILQVESDQLGVQWQLGSPRIDIKPDGRRGNS